MRFKPGHSGRPRGTRNVLTRDFIAALAKEFEEHGEAALKIVRIESPETFLKLIASLVPRELDISSRVSTLDDEELEIMIENLRTKLLQQSAPAMIEAKAIEVKDD